jgi:hypothetical protein
MFHWGSGPALGLLTCLGYAVFVLGAFRLWRNRAEFSFWVDDQLSILRRSFSRYVPAGSFYARRPHSRLRAIPIGFIHSVTRLPQRRFSWGAFLLILGILLFVLDFFV